MATARLATLDLPDFGMPEVRPEIPEALHVDRLARLRERAERRGFERLVVYADREHSANLAWLTGFDPRFEEAVLILGPDDDPAILVGNECYGLAGAAAVPMRRIRFQDLSLPSQPRDRSKPLAQILADEGIRRGTRVGAVGWKTYSTPAHPRHPGLPRRRAAGGGGPDSVETRPTSQSTHRRPGWAAAVSVGAAGRPGRAAAAGPGLRAGPSGPAVGRGRRVRDVHVGVDGCA
jgi:hypothetical protein